SQQFRFVQASNLALDRFCQLETDAPAAVHRLAIDAPFLAAERLFQTAIDEQAAFVLLAGGVFQRPEPSTWGASFLIRQAERLARHGITLLWAERTAQHFRRWPGFLPLERNIRLLSAEE